MKKILLAFAVLLAIAIPATATAATKDQAFKTASACLRTEAHASLVIRRGDGGGLASWNRKGLHGSTFWTYKTFLGQVDTATVYFAGQPGLPSQTQKIVRRCLVRGI